MAPTYKRTRGGGGGNASALFFFRHHGIPCPTLTGALHGLLRVLIRPPRKKRRRRRHSVPCAVTSNFPGVIAPLLSFDAFESKEVRKKGTKHKTEGFFYLVFSVDSLRARKKGGKKKWEWSSTGVEQFPFSQSQRRIHPVESRHCQARWDIPPAPG